MSVPTVTKWFRNAYCYFFGHNCDIIRMIQPVTLEALEVVCYCRRCHRHQEYAE